MLRRLNPICTLLAFVCLGSVTAGQIVIPPDVLKRRAESKKPKPIKPTSRKSTTRPAGARPDIQRMLIDFRRAGSGPKRQEAADTLLGVGPRGAKILRSIVAADLPRRTANYKKAFYSKARSIGGAKYHATGEARIKKWQAQFQATGAITKESLRAKAGPAMDALLDALVPKRSEVLENNESLAARRAEVIELDSILAQCNTALEIKSVDSKLSEKLKQQETLISLMCTSMSEAYRKSIESDMKKFDRMSFEEWHGFVHLNVLRILLGKRPMRVDLKLSDAARDHSKDMHELKFFAHQSPVKGKKTPWDRAARQGTTARGECIFSGRNGPGAIRGWFFSPGHHKIIMSNSSRVGIGDYKRKCTLMVG